MKKEKVLEIEIIKINDKYSAFYPVKLDIEKLKKIADGKSLGDGEYIPYIDLSINGYGYTILLTNEEIFPQVIRNEHIEKLKEEIKKLNEKYAKRWRAEEGEIYYYITDGGK